MIRTRTFAVALAIASAATAQTVVLAPSMASAMDGATSTSAVFYTSTAAPRSHVQILIDGADLGLATGVLDGIAFRAPGFGSMPPVAGNMRIEASMSPTPHTAAQATFAQNHGAVRTVVFDGPFALTATPAATTLPAGPMPTIQFTTPFSYDASQGWTLVLDIQTSNLSLGSSLPVAMAGVGGGSRESLWSSGACQTTQGTISSTLGFAQLQPYPGGTFVLGYNGYPTNRASFAFSLVMFDFSLTGTLGGFSLPTPLVNFGFPADPDCKLALVPEQTAAITYNVGQSGQASGNLSYTTTVPNLPGLAGAQFATQAISFDYDNSMPEPLVFPSVASRWTIGTGHLPAATMVTRTADTVPAQAAGGVQVNKAPIVYLHFQ